LQTDNLKKKFLEVGDTPVYSKLVKLSSKQMTIRDESVMVRMYVKSETRVYV